MTQRNVNSITRVIIVLAVGLVVSKESFSQSEKCFGACWGVTQVQPAYRIGIEAVKVYQGMDAVGKFTQLMIGGEPMRWIPGNHAAEIDSFIQELTQKEIAFVDIHQYSGGGYRLIGRSYDQRCVGGILIDPCNLANRDKPLGKMKTNRDRKRRNEGCEWATGEKPLRKMKTNRDRDNEGCEDSKGGKRLKPMKTNRKRDKEGCSETLGKKLRKTKPSRSKSSGCDLAKPGRKGQYGGRRKLEKSPCYD